MISDVPLGAFLSGGLDSSSIVYFAKQFNPNINCFTIDTGLEKNKGDLYYAKKVADHLKINLKIIKVNPFNFINSLENMVWHLDEPIADPASLNIKFISEYAKSQGIKVLLSGTGGDDVFSGYRRHLALNNSFFLDLLPNSTLNFIKKQTNNLSSNNNISRRIRKLFSGIDLKGENKLINYFRWIEEIELNKILSDKFKDKIKDSILEDPFVKYLDLIPSRASELEKMLILEQRFFLGDHNLNYTDKMSMSAGVEVRVPFLDKDLIDFSVRIPVKYKVKGMESKWVLKKAMEPFLPKDIIYRSKQGFGLPIRNWFKLELKGWIREFLSEEKVRKRGIFNPAAISNLILKNETGEQDFSYTILSIICLEIWCKKFLDN